MITIQDMDYAIDETIKKYPENEFKSVYAQIIGEVPGAINNITRSNGARERIAKATPAELAEAIAREIIKIYHYAEIVKKTDPEIAETTRFVEQLNILSRKCPGYDTVSRLTRALANPGINAVAYLLENNAALLDALHIVEKYHFDYNLKYRDVLEKYGYARRDEVDIDEKVRQDGAKLRGVRNVQVNPHAVNKCLEDIRAGIQVKNKFNDYELSGNLFASQHVGKRRSNQEDSVLIMEHPQNKDFKILVVADGMGGGVDGEKVSTYVVQEIAKWFQSISAEIYFNDPEGLQISFNRVISKISDDVYNQYNAKYDDRVVAGSTFTGAIITKDRTVITQVGDSRAYLVKNGNFLKRDSISLATRDDSFLWPRDKNLHPKDPSSIAPAEIEDIKYHHGSNIISYCIGDENLDAKHQSFIIPNTSYDKLLLMSDGASDLLSFEGIKIICRKTPWPKITKLLVEAALRKKAIRGKEWDAFYEKLANGEINEEELAKYNSLSGVKDEAHTDQIPAGKDNTTVAGYFRR